MRKLGTLCHAARFVLLMTATCWAQQDGVITGKITDGSGAVLPGVGLELTGPAVMGTRTAVSDETGTYRFGLVPPGVFTVKYELPGFKTLVREGIQASAGFTATINIVMEVATVAETVTVVGESPIVDVQSAQVNTNFNPTAIAVKQLSDFDVPLSLQSSKSKLAERLPLKKSTNSHSSVTTMRSLVRAASTASNFSDLAWMGGDTKSRRQHDWGLIG